MISIVYVAVATGPTSPDFVESKILHLRSLRYGRINTVKSTFLSNGAGAKTTPYLTPLEWGLRWACKSGEGGVYDPSGIFPLFVNLWCWNLAHS